jgi:hypothetical protein
MIQNDEQLRQTQEALLDLESSMASLNAKKSAIHPDRFALMAEPIVDHIRRLRADIDAYIGMTAVVADEAALWLRLEGPGIDLGDAPTSVVTAMIDILRVGVQAVAEYLERGMVGARPTALIKQACDLRIAGWAAGSVQVGLRLPEVPSAPHDELNVGAQARKALQLYLKAAAWAGSQQIIGQLEQELPDAEQRRLVLNQLARLVPRPRGSLESVELSGRAVAGGVVRLQREARDRIREAIIRTVREETLEENGVLREIDLDQRIFIVRDIDGNRETRCEIPSESDDLLEIAKDSLDHRVVVRGTRRKDPTRRQVFPLRVREIDVLGSEDEEIPF